MLPKILQYVSGFQLQAMDYSEIRVNADNTKNFLFSGCTYTSLEIGTK